MLKNSIKTVATGITMLIAVAAAALAMLHLFSFLYVLNVKTLDLPASTGYSYDKIMMNYNLVMSFLSPFSSAPFVLDGMNFSKEGAEHFYDCRVIFRWVYLAGIASAVSLVFLLRSLSEKARKISAGVVVVFPTVIMAAVAINFDAAFIIFHKIFFPGKSNWIFDYRVDEIINILPEQFFLSCAIFIVFLWVIAAAIMFFYKPRKAK